MLVCTWAYALCFDGGVAIIFDTRTKTNYVIESRRVVAGGASFVVFLDLDGYYRLQLAWL